MLLLLLLFCFCCCYCYLLLRLLRHTFCNPSSCSLLTCDPPRAPLSLPIPRRSIIPRITINADDATDGSVITFAQVGTAGGRDDTISIAGLTTPFLNKLAPFDIITITGTALNNARTYTINKVAARILTVDEDVVAEAGYNLGDVFIEAVRPWTTSQTHQVRVKTLLSTFLRFFFRRSKVGGVIYDPSLNNDPFVIQPF